MAVWLALKNPFEEKGHEGCTITPLCKVQNVDFGRNRSDSKER